MVFLGVIRDRFDTIVFHDKIHVHIHDSGTYNIIYYHYRNPNSLNAVKHFGYGFCRDLTAASASAATATATLDLFFSPVAVSL